MHLNDFWMADQAAVIFNNIPRRWKALSGLLVSAVVQSPVLTDSLIWCFFSSSFPFGPPVMRHLHQARLLNEEWSRCRTRNNTSTKSPCNTEENGLLWAMVDNCSTNSVSLAFCSSVSVMGAGAQWLRLYHPGYWCCFSSWTAAITAVCWAHA